ncbi:SDR family NAD(P)-dependent oxidoreductase [Acinetobacter lactucae]|uniref:SDR family NAD(P)-dependent oxidoreductase n=1 Tax=Acinetobacter lactucae TaxID=1785128 RepID=UPI0015F4B35E|nr:SDR family oxidoreductase [Acinetobacter lactucae]MDV7473222.1 SDR family oxidoreductase [Acinetobacter baumannii]
MKSLAGKNVLVTGATKGIGSEIVKYLHAEGANIIGHYGNDQRSAMLMYEKYKERLEFIQQDLSNPDAPKQLWKEALKLAGRIDVLVNNAGVYVSSELKDEQDWIKGWETNLQVNLQAPADLCRYAIMHFQENGGGIIINMASRSSHRGDGPEHLAYGAAKGGLLALTKGIARGYGDKNILAYALAPGWVRTSMADDLIAEYSEEVLAANLPLREITPPSDVAAMTAFLATGACRHATGSTIDITGADYVR